MTVAELQQLANTLRLSLGDSEAEDLCRDLASLEALCAPLLGVTEPPTDRFHSRGIDALREDRVGESLPIDALRALAPAWEDGYFPVPLAVEGGGAHGE